MTSPSFASLHRRIWALAWPLLLSNLTAPLLGLVNTAVVGHLDRPDYLAAVALGSNFFMVLYFSFNFLRMGTTGLTAQAAGAGQAITLILVRVLLLSVLLGGLLILLNPWLRDLALLAFGGSDAIQSLAADYINLRIFGAPAALANFALIGFAIGIQRSRIPLIMTLVMHTTNALLSYTLVYVWHWDIKGVAAASALADYLGLAVALLLLRRHLSHTRLTDLARQSLFALAPLKQLFAVNRDLFIRSLALLAVFFFFTAQGARLGDNMLAANAVLITFLLLLSNLLDGFANAAESLVGEAIGKANRQQLDRVVTATGLWSLLVSLIALLLFTLGGAPLIHLLTDLEEVRQLATLYLPWLLAIPLTATASFWLDGVFVGATRANDMRNTMLMAVTLFLLLWWLTRDLGNHGLWFAMNAFMAARGLLLGLTWLKRRKQLLV